MSQYLVTKFITREKFSSSSSSIRLKLGILVSNGGSSSHHVNSRKVSRTLNLFKQAFEYNADIARATFCSYIGSLLEYAVSVWSPRFRYEIDALESVQRQATKAKELSKVPYELRLEKLKIMDLETKRLT